MSHCERRSLLPGILRRNPRLRSDAMQYRRLGKSPLKVSTLCLGTMMFADQTDAAVAREIVAHAHGHGVNFIDTADVYAKGESEKMTGALLKDHRHNWVLATKL